MLNGIIKKRMFSHDPQSEYTATTDNTNEQSSQIQSVEFIKAAVIVPFFETSGELHVMLTKRSSNVRHHKGQICFPGGAKDMSDASLWHTAQREFEEELGISRNHIQYVSELPTLLTPTYFEVKPYIGFVHSEWVVRPNTDEVESVLMIPVQHFSDENNLRFEEREYFGKKFKSPLYTYHSHDIWGVTGRILHNCLKQWL